jgi:hypothetical protein
MTQGQIKITVCGHRCLSNLPYLETSILLVSTRIQKTYPGRLYQVYSCLAEGADRLLARILTQTLPADLTVVLPLLEKEYLNDFQTDKSIQEYFNLKQLAKDVITPDHKHNRPLAYQVTNSYLMEHCDLLVAIWDGLPARGPGGTAELVKSVRDSGKPLLWIHSNQETVSTSLIEERLNGIA